MATGKITRDDPIERIERERRAAIHRQIGALETRYRAMKLGITPRDKKAAFKLANKITALKSRLNQTEFRFGR